MQATDKYLNMRDSGSTPEQVYLALKEDGTGEIDSIRILRELFQLSLMEAKEVIITSDLPLDSLVEYQDTLFPTVLKAIETTEGPEGQSDEVSDVNGESS